LLFDCNEYRKDAKGEWVTYPCVPIEVTDNPNDIEAWQFEQRVIARGPYGIPVGRQPVDTGVVGPRETCERVRAAVIRMTKDRPTEPCQGPLRFRYNPAQPAPPSTNFGGGSAR
jgi:hypothetical protein